MSKVSIIVPIYNVEKYLSKCLDSLINQTFKDIEILAIIDGSLDNSIDIVKKYSKQDKRIKYIEKENGGYGSVLELGIKTIKSKYFVVCDADDWLERNAIEVLYNKMINNNVDLIVGDYYLYYKDNNKVYSTPFLNKEKLISNKIYTNLELFSFIQVSPHSKMYKTALAKNIKFPHKVSYTDNVLYFCYLNKCKCATYIDVALSNYYIDRPGNTNLEFNKSFNTKTFNSYIKVLNSIYSQIKIKNDLTYSIYYRLNLEAIVLLKKLNKLDEKDEIKKYRGYVLNYVYSFNKCKKNIYKCIKKYEYNKKIIKKIVFVLLYNKYLKNILVYMR